MNREEAIAVLEKEAIIIDDNSIEMTKREWDEFDDLKRDAIHVAIEALEAKTDGDLISRQDAIDAIRSTVAQYVPFLNGVNETLPIECEIALRSVPSAETEKEDDVLPVDAVKRVYEEGRDAEGASEIYREERTMINIDKENFATLCICAIRYCHGRKTYMPSLVREIVGRHLSELSDRDIEVMYDDCRFMNPSDYGDEIIDKPNWLLWEKKLKKEVRRREAEASHE